MNKKDKKQLLNKIYNSPERDVIIKSLGNIHPKEFINSLSKDLLIKLKSDVDKSYNKPRELITEYPGIKIYKNFKWVIFSGCQCFKDCTCKEDFNPFWKVSYSVEFPFGKLNNLSNKKLIELLDELDSLGWISKSINIEL